jgi:nitric oxide dioxygenase
MTTTQINNIQYSWDQIALVPNAMLSFYDRLFEIAPEVRTMFPEDLTKQSEKLAYTIGFVVSNLHRLPEIKSSIEDLGRKHSKLKVKPEHYTYVKTALLETIERAMKDNYNEDIGNAWDDALTYVATVMINAPEKRENGFKKLLSKIFPQ